MLRHPMNIRLAIYVVLLIPASVLGYAGLLWVGVSDGGWRTQVAAAALVTAWFILALGACYFWTSSRMCSPPGLLSRAAPVVAVLALYAVAFAWGGRMLI